MVNQVTNNLLDDYHPSNRNPPASNPTTSNELISGYNQVSLIYDNVSPPHRPVHQQSVHQQSVHQQPVHQQPIHQQPVHQQPVEASGSGASYSTAACSTSYYYPPSYSNASYQSSSFASFASAGPSSVYPTGYPPATSAPYYSPADQFHNSQLIRRNSFNNYDQSTDSEQYLINSYYELSDHLEQPAAAAAPVVYGSLPEQDQQFIENYHHLNYSSSQIANNPNYIYESYPAEYLTDRDNALNFNSMIIFDSSLCQRFRERLKHVCSKNLPCMLIVLLPIFFATILILFFVRIYKSDKTDKDDLHAYAIYAFIIFSILFISPFALFFSIVVINKIIKKYNKCFNPNFIGNEFGDLISANAVDPASLLSAAAVHPLASSQTGAYQQHLANANLTVNLANAGQTHDLHPSPLLNAGQITDLQGSLPNGLATGLAIGSGLGNATLSSLALANGGLANESSQQISTLNVNQLQYNSANSRQLINEMIEEFDAMNPADQERTLQRMSSIQRRQRLIRQNAFESATFDAAEQQQPSLGDLICYDDKPPSYELALLCPKKRDCEPDKTKKETDKKSASKLASDCINYVNLSESLSIRDPSIRDPSVRDPSVRDPGRRDDLESRDGIVTNSTDSTIGTLGNTVSNGLPVNGTAGESQSTLQTELRNNLENRRRSSNGSSINTEPPTYSSLYTLDPKEEDAK